MENETNAVDEAFKASYGVNAEVPGPVDMPSNKRPADTKDEGESKPALLKSKMISAMMDKAYKMKHSDLSAAYEDFMKGGDDLHKKNLASITVKEDVESILSGEDELSEGFKDKATALFESAVHAKVIAETARIEDEYNVRLQEEVLEITEALNEQVDSYLTHVAEEWVEENKLAVETGIRTEVLESFMSGLKNLFTEHYIDIPEDKVDVVEAMADQIQELETKLNEEVSKSLALSAELQEAKATEIFAEVTEGLSDSQVDKLRTLSEGLSYGDLDEYKTKLTAVVENYSASARRTGGAEEQLNEEVEITEEKSTAAADPTVLRYVDAISRTIKR